MKKRILSLVLCFGIVATSIPNIKANASIETAKLYNIKSSVLGASKYDNAYDTNEDGVVNVFDVIRTNKEVVQGESYNDLKNKVSILEQQIQTLIEQLSNKEESKGNEFSDKDKAKLDSLQNYDDTEIREKLDSLNNYDDTEIREKLDSLSNYDDTVLTEGKVDKEEGKGLSSNDFTDEDKAKLDGLENYDDTEIKKKLEGLHNYDDTEIREKLDKEQELVGSLVDRAFDEKEKFETEISEIINNKVDQEEGKGLSSNDFTDDDKSKLDGLINYDDTEIKKQLECLHNYDDTELKESKVDKEEGKGLSSNDFTNEDKSKLDKLAETCELYEIKKYYVGNNGDYDSLMTAFVDLANDSSEKIIYIYGGVYDIYAELGGKEYLNSISETTNWNDVSVFVPDNTKVIGMGDVTLTYLPDASDFTNPNQITCVSPINTRGNCEIHNIKIKANNCRYCIHDEAGGYWDGTPRRKLYKNVYAEKIPNTYKPSGSYISGQAYACGMITGYDYIFEECYFKSRENYCWTVHTGGDKPTVESTDGNNITMNNCIFESPSWAGIRFGSSPLWGKQTYVKVMMNNCFVENQILLTKESETNPETINQYELWLNCCNDVRIHDKYAEQGWTNIYTPKVFNTIR